MMRHAVFSGILLVVLGSWFQRANADGIRALDAPAMTARAPAHDFLIAITRAGDRLVAVGEHGLIIYSDDNGVTWKQAAVPVGAELTAVRFASPMDGWAAGHYGVILHTQDGGLTWQTQLTGIQADQMTLAAAQAAVAANDPSPGTPLALRRAARFAADGPDIPFLTIWAPSTNNAFVFGAYRMAEQTTDGGKTWRDISLEVADPFSHNLYDAAAAGDALFIAGEAGMVFRSADQGATFQAVPLPASTTMLGVIDTGAQVLAYGVAGQAYRSDDAGRDWVSVVVGTNVNLTTGCLLGDGTIILANEYGALYESRDHGQTFVTLMETVPMAVFDMVEAADHSLIAVGNAGVMRITAPIPG